MINQIDIQTKFEELLQLKFPHLQPINKWKQTMWHIDGNLINSSFKKNQILFFQ
jgi:uncharacterized protein YdhG (YjbR/CyaY superfamily)